jgi:predicted N-acetyltransferase YhbS
MTLTLRPMTAADIPLGMRLKQQAGWNQIEADWRRFLDLAEGGAFVAELDGRGVGTTVTSVLGRVAWIAMVLVDEAIRGRGVGKRLVAHALEHLDRLGVPTIRLDATPLGRPLYKSLGFVAEYELARWEMLAASAAGESRTETVAVRPGDLDAIVALDRRATGADRRRLIERLYRDRPDAIEAVRSGPVFSGYLAQRPGARAVQIGPGVAVEAQAGLALADAALRACAGQKVFVDIPEGNAPASEWAASRGFAIQRPLTRMRRGEPVEDRPHEIWASSGPEMG